MYRPAKSHLLGVRSDCHTTHCRPLSLLNFVLVNLIHFIKLTHFTEFMTPMVNLTIELACPKMYSCDRNHGIGSVSLLVFPIFILSLSAITFQTPTP